MLRGEALGPLHGVPFAVKDHVQVKGVAFRDGPPAEGDHFGVERLRKAGAILMGGNTMMGQGGGGVQQQALRLEQPEDGGQAAMRLAFVTWMGVMKIEQRHSSEEPGVGVQRVGVHCGEERFRGGWPSVV